MENDNSSNRVAELESELEATRRERDESNGRELAVIKKFAVTQLLSDRGFSQAQVKEALPVIEPLIARGADGSLEGVDSALAYLAKTRPDLTTVKVAAYKPVNTPPSKTYVPPSDSDEKLARKIFGPGSDSRLANHMGLQDPAQYKRLKSVAKILQLVA